MNKKILLKAVLILSAFVFWAECSHAACDETNQSFKEAYIKSDVVFEGTFKEKQESYYVFDVKALFKASHKSFEKKKTIKVNSEGPDGIKFPETTNFDWMIFGSHKKLKKENIVETSSCSKTYLSPFSYLAYTRENKAKLKQELVFVGELLRVDDSDYDKSSDLGRSKLFFRVDDLIKNEVDEKFLQNMRELMVNAVSCGKKFHVGHRYVVSANMKSVPVTTKGGKPFKDEKGQQIETSQIHVECSQHTPMNLNLAGYLRSLESEQANSER